jgi:hypothetical protein
VSKAAGMQHLAEKVVFDLRKKVNVYLAVGDTETHDRILTTISNLEELYGIRNRERTRTHPPKNIRFA